jgi:preprotein translocase subunit SecF
VAQQPPVFDIVGKRLWFFVFSLVILLPGIVSLIIPPHLKAGIDFRSGTEFTVRFSEHVAKDDLQSAMADLGHDEARVQGTGDNEFIVRTEFLPGTDAPSVGPKPPSEENRIAQGLAAALAPLLDAEGNPTDSFIDSSSVDASVSGSIDIGKTFSDTLWETPPSLCCGIVGDSITAIAFGSLAIFVYLWWSFRSVAQSFRFGGAAILALLHDVLIVVGVFSILGRVFGTEIDKDFVVAILTVIGFSVHDSIVVFDRVRETVARGEGRNLSEAVNNSLLQTLGRSMNTTLTLIFAILALLLMGGESIRDFLIAMLVGTITGAYSWVFIASQILVSWDEGDVPRFFRRIFGRPEPPEEYEAEAAPAG